MEITIVGAAAHLHLFTFLFKTCRKVAFKAYCEYCRTTQDSRGVNHKTSRSARSVEQRPVRRPRVVTNLSIIAHHTLGEGVAQSLVQIASELIRAELMAYVSHVYNNTIY